MIEGWTIVDGWSPRRVGVPSASTSRCRSVLIVGERDVAIGEDWFRRIDDERQLRSRATNQLHELANDFSIYPSGVRRYSLRRTRYP